MRRLGRIVATAAPFGAVLAVVFVILPGGAGAKGYGPLAILPAVGVALYGSRRQLHFFLAGVAAALPALLLLDGGMTASQVRWTLFFGLSAALTTFGVARVVHKGKAEVAERERAHAALERTRERLLEAQASAHIGSWEWDVARDHFTCSDELLRVYGLAPGSAVASRVVLVDSVHQDDRLAVSVVLEAAVDRNEPFHFEHRILRGRRAGPLGARDRPHDRERQPPRSHRRDGARCDRGPHGPGAARALERGARALRLRDLARPFRAGARDVGLRPAPERPLRRRARRRRQALRGVDRERRRPHGGADPRAAVLLALGLRGGCARSTWTSTRS